MFAPGFFPLVALCTNFIKFLDEINGIRYSQNELDNGNLTAIQLVNYLTPHLLIKRLLPHNHTTVLRFLTPHNQHQLLYQQVGLRFRYSAILVL